MASLVSENEASVTVILPFVSRALSDILRERRGGAWLPYEARDVARERHDVRAERRIGGAVPGGLVANDIDH
jgi:hypothetical protein